MAKKKRHINNSKELEQAVRTVGGVIPYTLEELSASRKMVDEETLQNQVAKFSFDDIWNSNAPLINSQVVETKVIDIQQKINKSWGMAARGGHHLSDEVINKMIKNEEGHDK